MALSSSPTAATIDTAGGRNAARGDGRGSNTCSTIPGREKFMCPLPDPGITRNSPLATPLPAQRTRVQGPDQTPQPGAPGLQLSDVAQRAHPCDLGLLVVGLFGR